MMENVARSSQDSTTAPELSAGLAIYSPRFGRGVLTDVPEVGLPTGLFKGGEMETLLIPGTFEVLVPEQPKLHLVPAATPVLWLEPGTVIDHKTLGEGMFIGVSDNGLPQGRFFCRFKGELIETFMTPGWYASSTTTTEDLSIANLRKIQESLARKRSQDAAATKKAADLRQSQNRAARANNNRENHVGKGSGGKKNKKK